MYEVCTYVSLHSEHQPRPLPCHRSAHEQTLCYIALAVQGSIGREQRGPSSIGRSDRSDWLTEVWGNGESCSDRKQLRSDSAKRRHHDSLMTSWPCKKAGKSILVLAIWGREEQRPHIGTIWQKRVRIFQGIKMCIIMALISCSDVIFCPTKLFDGIWGHLRAPMVTITKYIVKQSGHLQCFITVEICTLRATREQNHLAVTHKLSRVFSWKLWNMTMYHMSKLIK